MCGGISVFMGVCVRAYVCVFVRVCVCVCVRVIMKRKCRINGKLVMREE